MIKFYTQADIAGAKLLISFASEGHTGNFASSLLINNNKFVNIGFLFSHYLIPYASLNQKSPHATYNGEIFFNEDKKLVLINFFAGTPHYYRKKFFQELVELIQMYQFEKVFIYGGISKIYAHDAEIQSASANVYYLTNDFTFNIPQSILKFEDLCKIEKKKKIFEELKYIEHSGLAKPLVKFLSKNSIQFYYMFTFSNELFDPLMGFALFKKLNFMFQFSDEDIVVGKTQMDQMSILNEIAKIAKFESSWNLFLKE